MKKHFLLIVLTISMFAGAPFAAQADGLDDIAGKWSTSKTNNEGNAFKQIIDFKKDKFVFRIMGADDKAVFYAEGKIKLDKTGDLLVIKFTDIQYGKSKEELQAADEERTDIYALRDGKLILASNFDKERDGQPPGLDTYEKVAEKSPDASKEKAK